MPLTKQNKQNTAAEKMDCSSNSLKKNGGTPQSKAKGLRGRGKDFKLGQTFEQRKLQCKQATLTHKKSSITTIHSCKEGAHLSHANPEVRDWKLLSKLLLFVQPENPRAFHCY